jgi:hypothetical protein
VGALLVIAPICANPASGGEASPAELRIGGALRFNYFLKSWEGEEANRERGGDLEFDTFRINIDASKSSVDLSLEYRFYAGYHMLHHGYVGTTTEGGTNWYLGVHRKPFGLLPFSSNNWFFNITYYLGMEDDADAGLGVRIPLNNTTIDIAFFKNDEGSFTGNSIASARYSYDIVHTDDGELGYAGLVGSRSNRETNQGNIRLAHLFGELDSRSLEAGVSAEYGGLYNSVTAQTGHHQAFAVHADGRMGKFRLMLEAIDFEFTPKNPGGQDNDFVVFGAYDAPYMVSAKGRVYLANLSVHLPVVWGPVTGITLYNDYGYLDKKSAGYSDTQQNVTGVSFGAGDVYVYVDYAMGLNHPWLSGRYGDALAVGYEDAHWESRFNVNIGYYF